MNEIVAPAVLRSLKLASGFFCKTPAIFDFAGEMLSRPCGHCGRCVARKKRDLAGRAAAEAATSDSLVVFTLTYRPGEAGAFEWVTKDRQRFLYRVRSRERDAARKAVGAPRRLRTDEAKAFWRPKIAAATRRVRYIGCGERGEKGTKRHHWHVVLFFSGGDACRETYQTSPRDDRGRLVRETLSIWPHGFVTVDVLPKEMPAKIRACRYVAKYVGKSLLTRDQRRQGDKASAKIFRSTKPALGAAYLDGWARDHARAGVPLPRAFKVPNFRFSRGHAGQTETGLSSASARAVCEAYADEWAKVRPAFDLPDSPLRARYCDHYRAPHMRHPERPKPRLSWRARGPLGLPPLLPKSDHCAGTLVVQRGRQTVGMVEMLRNGVAVWVPLTGPMALVADGSLRAIVDLPDEDHVRCETWIAEKRGPGWTTPQERFERFEDRRCASAEAKWRALGGAAAMVVGVHTFHNLTDHRRRAVMLGLMTADGKAVRRRYEPPRDLERLVERDLARRSAEQKPDRTPEAEAAEAAFRQWRVAWAGRRLWGPSRSTAETQATMNALFEARLPLQAAVAAGGFPRGPSDRGGVVPRAGERKPDKADDRTAVERMCDERCEELRREIGGQQ